MEPVQAPISFVALNPKITFLSSEGSAHSLGSPRLEEGSPRQSGSSPRLNGSPRTPRSSLTPKRYTVNPQVKKLDIMGALRQMSISSPRPASARTPHVEFAHIIENTPCDQSVRVVADICGKLKRMSGPPGLIFVLDELNAELAALEKESESHSILKSPVSSAQPDVQQPSSASMPVILSPLTRIAKLTSLPRNSLPSMQPVLIEKSSTYPLDLATQNHKIKKGGDAAWNLEFMLEVKALKIENKIKKLMELKIPMKAEELRVILRELDVKKRILSENPDLSYPAAFRVQASGGGCILQVHNRKKIYIYFPAKTISEGEYKTVYPGWGIIHKIKRVAIAIAKLESSPRGIAAASVAAANEEKYLRMFNYKPRFVKLYDAFYFSGNKQVLVMKYYPEDLLVVINRHVVKKNPPSDRRYDLVEKVRLMIHIFEGINVMHRKCKVVHRDIKPENYLIDDKGIALTDFGFACPASNIGELNKFQGSFPYLSIEILNNDFIQNGFKQDLWGAACIGFMLIFEKAYPWHQYLTKPLRVDKAIEKIMVFNQKLPHKRNILPRLFWEMFHPIPSQRPDAEEILQRFGAIACELEKASLTTLRIKDNTEAPQSHHQHRQPRNKKIVGESEKKETPK